ncbi:MAG: DUF1330 domain-containing protein [Sulfitobacter sp.]
MTHFIDPDHAQFEAFKALDRDTELNMLNLVKFNDLANYPGDHPMARDGMTGAQAYAVYGEKTGPILEKVGGTIVWRGQFELTFIGPSDEEWDAMFIVRYANAKAFLAMVTDPEYQKAVVHRQAAVKTSRLIRTQNAGGGDQFA